MDLQDISSNNIELDEEKIERLARKIIMDENLNLRTGKLTESKMIEHIRKLIQEETTCYSKK